MEFISLYIQEPSYCFKIGNYYVLQCLNSLEPALEHQNTLNYV